MKIVSLHEDFHEVKKFPIFVVMIEADEEEIRKLRLGECKITQK